MTVYFAEQALLPRGWSESVRIEIDDGGTIASVTAGALAKDAVPLQGPVIPGLPNVHSLAPLRAIAGLLEGADRVAVERETHRRLQRVGPEAMQAIAAQTYLDMLRSGVTAVGEFHLWHHAHDGERFDDPAEMAHRLVRAARQVGIGISVLPALFACADFGAAAAETDTRRLQNTPDEILDICVRLQAAYGDDPQIRIGIATHSLAAVTPEMLATVVAGVQASDPMTPIHLTAAATAPEVEACRHWRGARPVEWLLSHAPVDGRWCLLHATHLSTAETSSLAASDAVAGLCPSSESSLGDGLFPLAPYLAAGGKLAIGSGRNLRTDLLEELRWLEWGQRASRLSRREAASGHPGSDLLLATLEGGSQALGRPIGRIAKSHRADLVVLDEADPSLARRSGDRLPDALIFAGSGRCVRHVMVGGEWVIRDYKHDVEEVITTAFDRAIAPILG